MKIGTMELAAVNGYAAEMVTVTPAAAAELLRRNTSNRKIRAAVVAKYASEIAHGEWRAVPAGVGIDERGVLIDGQHRLAAIVQSGIAAPMLVVVGFPRASQEKCDRHAKRTITDVMRLAGYDVDERQMSAATYLARHALGGVGERSMPADCEVKATLERYGKDIAAISAASGNIRPAAAQLLRRAGCVAALAQWHHHEPAAAMAFRKHILDGTAPSRNHPAAALVRGIEGANWWQSQGGAGQQAVDFRRVWYAIQAVRENRDITSIREYAGTIPWPV